jgi:hypothetical protein
MEAAIRTARSSNIDIAMLIARRAVDGYYNRFGFWGVAQYSKTTFKMTTLPMNGESIKSIEVRSLTHEDLGVCAVLYAKSYEGLVGHCLRTPKMWNYILRKLHYLGMHLDLVVVDHQVAGYVIHDRQENIYEIATGETPPICGANMFLKAFAPRCESLTLNVPPAHPFLAGLKGADVSLTLRECPYGGHMIKILNPALVDPLSNDARAKTDSIGFDQTTRALRISRVTDINSATDIGVRGSFNIPLLDQI